MAPEILQLSPILWCKQNHPFATNTGLIISGNQACLIDPGISAADIDKLQQFISERRTVVTSIILTHAHWDHLLGAAYFSGTRVITHQRYQHVVKEHRMHLVRQVSEWSDNAGFSAHESWMPPEPSIVFTQSLTAQIGNFAVRVSYAPGHTEDHTAVYIPKQHILWAGDMLSDSEIPLVEDITAYERTLLAFQAYHPQILVPGHGTPTVDASAIHSRITQDLTYVGMLHGCVQHALESGYDCPHTVQACLDIPFAQREDYPNAHHWNIESAFRCLGGSVASPVGWENEWLPETD